MTLHRPGSLALQAISGYDIPNELRRERPPVSLRAAVDLVKELWPNAIFRSISNTYNCGGLAFACRRVWVSPEVFVQILQADGYRRLKGPEESEAGDVVIYHGPDNEPCHVGLVVRKNLLPAGATGDLLTVLSKWGGDGEYVHQASEVPGYLGKPAQYWTDRRAP